MKKLFFILLLLTASFVESPAMGLPNSIYIQKSIAKGEVTKQDLRVSIKENTESKQVENKISINRFRKNTSSISIFEKIYLFLSAMF